MDCTSLFEQSACGLLVTGTDGMILRANAVFCHWLGYPHAELANTRRVQDLLTVGARVFHQTHCLPLLQMQGSVAELQVEMLHRDGQRLPILMNVARRQHEGATVDHYAVIIATDRRSYERELLKARKAAEAALEARHGAEARLHIINQQLSAADRSKDEFLATLAHELRNPLAPMRNVLEVLKLQLAGAPAQQPTLDILERQLRHLTHLVDDLMEVSRITQGQLELRCEALDLRVILRAAGDDSRTLMGKARHRLEVDLPEAPLLVNGDATRLMQIVMNLLTNAAKYTPEGGLVQLYARSEGAEALVGVRDNGIGIPPEALLTVFDMFSQLSPALERSQGGLGIGLALVRGLVALHGGTIAAFSAGVGQGSEFVMRLPLHHGEMAIEEIVAAAQDERCRVLVVDDNADAAETMVMALELLGFDARPAHDGASALRAAADYLPDVILLDIGLPDMSGYEIARRIRGETWGVRVFLVAATGWGQESDRARAQEAGFDRHMTKPIDFDKLRVLMDERPRIRSS